MSRIAAALDRRVSVSTDRLLSLSLLYLLAVLEDYRGDGWAALRGALCLVALALCARSLRRWWRGGTA